MRHHVVVIACVLAACGRIGFDPADLAIGHDEDGDGIVDADDVCPHLAGTQLDSDGDRVGDDCDPHPSEPRDSILRFATMMAGDQPFTTVGDDGVWIQRDDSFEFTGVPQPDEYLFAGLAMDLVVQDVRVALGIDILDRFDGMPQNQIALGLEITSPPVTYVELNESPTSGGVAQVTIWDGGQFIVYDPQVVPAGIHRGSVFFQGTYVVGAGAVFDVAWPNEPYRSEFTGATYQGSEYMQININNLLLEIRWLIVITSS